MISDMMKLVDRFVDIFKKPLYGKTFYCPVCHLELSFHDTDESGNLVCPLCGVVIELHETYGHPIPIVNDVEINRVQPKMRMHPLATHLPIGLFPFALLGGFILLFISAYSQARGIAVSNYEFWRNASLIIDQATTLFLFIAVASSALTFFTGFMDWKKRYGGRPYRIITLKIILSGIFLAIGVLLIAMHVSIFTAGVTAFGSVLSVLGAIVYLFLLAAAMFMLATLGHVGGYLVYGK